MVLSAWKHWRIVLFPIIHIIGQAQLRLAAQGRVPAPTPSRLRALAHTPFKGRAGLASTISVRTGGPAGDPFGWGGLASAVPLWYRWIGDLYCEG
jgi:hypothetical protein